MVSESLTLTFNLLTGYFSRQQPSSLRLGDVFFWNGVCRSSAVFAFFSKTRIRICEKFFSGFVRKHLIITTCVEKQCTRSLILCYRPRCRLFLFVLITLLKCLFPGFWFLYDLLEMPIVCGHTSYRSELVWFICKIRICTN